MRKLVAIANEKREKCEAADRDGTNFPTWQQRASIVSATEQEADERKKKADKMITGPNGRRWRGCQGGGGNENVKKKRNEKRKEGPKPSLVIEERDSHEGKKETRRHWRAQTFHWIFFLFSLFCLGFHSMRVLCVASTRPLRLIFFYFSRPL